MDAFTRLFSLLDATTKTSTKLRALEAYFTQASADDRLWAIWLLTGNRPKRVITTTQLKDWATAASGVPRWLFDESYVMVGDLGETISLIIGRADGGAVASSASPSLTTVMNEIISLKGLSEAERQAYIVGRWQKLSQTESFIFTKLITGSFRVGVAKGLAVRGLATVLQLDPADLQHRLLGGWQPWETSFEALLDTGVSLRPYPFFLASPLDEPERLGEPAAWQAEWKWDGIRGQIVRQGGETAIWSRGEELVSAQFPELLVVGSALPDGTVIDGEIMPWGDDGPLSFAILQTRLGRKVVSEKVQRDAPVVFVAYDLLEAGGVDLRDKTLSDRRQLLEGLVADLGLAKLRLSPVVPFTSWAELAELRARSREERAEGYVIKRLDSPYRTGRVRGDWWKWKIEPYTLDAVLTTAQRGHGRRAGLYTDYTFAIWDGPTLVPIAKAYSGLTDAEITEVDRFVNSHTVEKFGPIRTVTPELVFELAFEGIAESKRHKSGLAVRFPRILRWRRDKPASEADSVETVRALLQG
jgi:DNA ligase-1